MPEKRKLMILGSGPAGLLAAHAASQVGGWDIRIASKNAAKSTMYGAQYLHEPIPGIEDIRQDKIDHKFEGSIEGYRSKVYGTEWEGVVSPKQYSGSQTVWDIRQMYDRLWNRWSPHLEDRYVTPSRMDSAIEYFDLVISTVPAPALCEMNHRFQNAQIFALGDGPGIRSVPIKVQENSIVCSGNPDISWYRTSNIFGHNTIEWPAKGRKKPPIEGVVRVNKPISTNCHCFSGVVRIGRYGAWRKGVLVHDAYHEALSALQR